MRGTINLSNKKKILLIGTVMAFLAGFQPDASALDIQDTVQRLKTSLQEEKNVIVDTDLTVSLGGFEYKGIVFKGLKSSTSITLKKNGEKTARIVDSKEFDVSFPENYRNMALLFNLIKKEDNTFYLRDSDLFFSLGNKWYKITPGESMWNFVQEGEEEGIQTHNVLSKNIVRILKGLLGMRVFEGLLYLDQVESSKDPSEKHIILKGECPDKVKEKMEKILSKLPLGEKSLKKIQFEDSSIRIIADSQELIPYKVEGILKGKIPLEDKENMTFDIRLTQTFDYPESLAFQIPPETETALDLTHKSDDEIRDILMPPNQ